MHIPFPWINGILQIWLVIIFYIGKQSLSFEIPGTLGIIQDAEYWQQEKSQHYPLFTLETYQSHQKRSAIKNFLRIDAGHYDETIFEILRNDATSVIILTTDNAHAMAEQRRFYLRAAFTPYQQTPLLLLILFRKLTQQKKLCFDSATDAGALLLDGLGDGLMLSYHDNRSHKIMNDMN
jgi:(E)-4-hydroxy-3-methylbut-2-enyl-diphosphate synthase